MLTLLLKLKSYAIALASVLLAILGAFAWGRLKSTKAVKEADQEAQIKAQAEAMQQQAQTRQEVDREVSQLPKPKVTVPEPLGSPEKPQKVSDAQPDTAADELRKDWLRPS